MKNTKIKTRRSDEGGFRIAWFIPVECVMFGTMLALGPRFITGVGVVLAVFLLPLFIFVTFVSLLELYEKRDYLVNLRIKKVRRNFGYIFVKASKYGSRINNVLKRKVIISKPKAPVLVTQK